MTRDLASLVGSRSPLPPTDREEIAAIYDLGLRGEDSRISEVPRRETKISR